MGYSDIGCFGGEVHTPYLDALAGSGLRFTQFYNTGRCCPTRASLLTGLHPHQAGIGWMTETPGDPRHGDFGVDRYSGRIHTHLPTVADALHGAGYRTMMAGKWHVGMNDQASWPLQRGFDRFHVKNLHATILRQLGFDANALTYFHNGLDDSLVGVEGAQPIHQVIA